MGGLFYEQSVVVGELGRRITVAITTSTQTKLTHTLQKSSSREKTDAHGLSHEKRHSCTRSKNYVIIMNSANEIRLLKKHNMRTIHIPQRKTTHIPRSAKAGLELKVQGVYRIPPECGKVYVEHRERTNEARFQEHHRCVHLH